VQIVGVHDSALVELNLREVTLEQTFQLQIRLLPAINNAAEWLACWTQAQYDLGSNRSRDAVG